MVIELIVVAAAFTGGIGVGRIKNRAKLQAAQNLLSTEEAKANAEAKTVIARLRAALRRNHELFF